MLMQMEMMVIINSHCPILYFGIAITIIVHTKVQSSNLKILVGEEGKESHLVPWLSFLFYFGTWFLDL
jgi:hypothetical protein